MQRMSFSKTEIFPDICRYGRRLICSACIAGRTSLAFFLAVVIYLLYTGVAYADSESNSGISIVISDVKVLSVDADSLTLSPAAPEVLSGWTEQQTWNVTICANVEWALTIRGTAPTWDGPWLKPVGDIFFSSGGSDFAPVETESTRVCTGGPSDNEVRPINFKIALDPLKDIPGEYFYGYIVLEFETL